MYAAWASELSASAFSDDPRPLCRSGQEAPLLLEWIRGNKLARDEFCTGLYDVWLY